MSNKADQLLRAERDAMGFVRLTTTVALLVSLFVPVMGCSETEPLTTEVKCGEYCDKVDECYRIYLSACMQDCSDGAERELGISAACASAAAAERACVAELTTCEEVALWGYRFPKESYPCLAEASAFDAECESACEEDAECDDGKECTADVCDEGRCVNEASWCPCEAPLSDYCEGPECLSWDEAVAVAETCQPHWRAVAGQCGDFRYITMYWGMDESTQYFDAAGELVARTGCTDCNCIECGPGHDAFCIHYGPIPQCEKQEEQVLCEEPL